MRWLATATTLLLGCPKPVAAPTPVVVASEPEPEREAEPRPPPLLPRAAMRFAIASADGVEGKCRKEDLRRCLQGRAYPSEPLEWELEVMPSCRARDCPPGTAETNLVAVVESLLAHGGYNVYLRGRGSVIVQLGYEDVRAAARLDATDRSLRRACFFCRPISAAAIGPRCVSQRLQTVGCGPTDVGCSLAQVDASAPDGTRWRLLDSCLPAAPGWTSAARMSDLPSCDD